MHLSRPLFAAALFVTFAEPLSARADEPAPYAPTVTPLPSEPAPVPRARRSTGMMAGGIVLASLGGVAAMFGAGAILSRDTSRASCETTNAAAVSVGLAPIDCTNHSSTTPAIALIGGGIAGLAVGLPLAIYGGQRIPATSARLTFTPQSGGGVGGVTVSF